MSRQVNIVIMIINDHCFFPPMSRQVNIVIMIINDHCFFPPLAGLFTFILNFNFTVKLVTSANYQLRDAT